MTIPSYTFEDTSNPDLKRFCDRNGDWQFYFNEKQKVFKPAVNHILGLGYAKSKGFYDYLLSVSKEEAKKKLDLAGDEGSRTHDAIKDIIGGVTVKMTTKYLNRSTGRQEILNNDEWDNLIAFEKWCHTYYPQTIDYEKSVDSDQFNYAGTFDWLGTVLVPEGDKAFPKDVQGKRVMVLMDWKSSSGIWPEYWAQLSAYFKAIQEKLYNFSKFENPIFTGILRVGSRHKVGYEFKIQTLEETEASFRKFLAAREIGSEGLEKGDIEIEELPIEFSVKVPIAKNTRNKMSIIKKPKEKKLKKWEISKKASTVIKKKAEDQTTLN